MKIKDVKTKLISGATAVGVTIGMASAGINSTNNNDLNNEDNLNNNSTSIEQSISDVINPVIEEDNVEVKQRVNHALSITLDKENEREVELIEEALAFNTNIEIDNDMINRLSVLINNYDGELGFSLESLDGTSYINYNDTMDLFAASTMKIPLCMYICQNLEKENKNLNDVFDISNRTRDHDEDGDIWLHPKYYPKSLWQYYGEKTESNDKYTTRDLMTLTLDISDNMAKDLLQERYVNNSEFNNYLKSIGCNDSKIPAGRNWMYTNTEDLLTIWKEYYKYSQESNYGAFLMNISENTRRTMFKDVLDSSYASKFGYTSSPNKVYLETGIIYAENPYYIVLTFKFNGKDMDYGKAEELLFLLNKVIEKDLEKVR